MGKLKEILINAEQALREVRDLVQNTDMLEDIGGYVEALYAVSPDTFLIMYTTDIGVFFYKSVSNEDVALIDIDAFNSLKPGAADFTDVLPELLLLVNDRRR